MDGCNEGCSDGCEVGNIVNNVGAAVIKADGLNVGKAVLGLLEVGCADVTVIEGEIVGNEL